MASIVADGKFTLALALAAGAVAVGALYLYFVSYAPRRRKVMLEKDTWVSLRLEAKEQLSHNVILFRFGLPPTSVLGLPIGQHVSIRGVDADGKEFTRPYTPTTLDTDLGHVDLVIKVYPQGAMSQYLKKLQVGESIPFKGPKGRFNYVPNMFQEIGMIAGGTGITPMYQVARAVLENPADETKISLIFANVKEDDILLKDDLEAMTSAHPDRIKIYYVLNEPPTGWTGGVGFVSKELIQSFLPKPSDGVKVLRCGPPGMNKAMAAHLDDLGYSKEMQFQF